MNMTNCKKCRRAGEKLFLKGERCSLPKCAMVKRNYPPGQHGNKGQKRMSEYGTQLATKQRLKHIYGIRERQLRRYFDGVKGQQGDIAQLLLRKLESRLDNAILKSGVASSMDQARQMVNHGFFEVNDRKVDIPSYEVRAGDEIKMKESKAKRPVIAEKLAQVAKQDGGSQWAVYDSKEKKIRITDLPNTERLEGVGNVGLVVEYYSR